MFTRCFAPTHSLDPGQPRFRDLTQCMKDTYAHDPGALWDAFGIAPGVKVLLLFVFASPVPKILHAQAAVY